MKIDNTKDIILHVAGKIFKQHGFHKTTIDGIARAAHKAKGSIYYHFKSKEELFQGVVEKEFQTLRSELIKAIDDGKNAKEKLAIKRYTYKWHNNCLINLNSYGLKTSMLL